MNPIPTAYEIYPAVEELIEQLRHHPTSTLSAVLNHRMHHVAWTARDELLEELANVLTAALAKDAEKFDLEVRTQIERVICAIHRTIQADQ